MNSILRYKKINKNINRNCELTVDEAVEKYHYIKKEVNITNKNISHILSIIDVLIQGILSIKPYKEQYYCVLGLYEGYVENFKILGISKKVQ